MVPYASRFLPSLSKTWQTLPNLFDAKLVKDKDQYLVEVGTLRVALSEEKQKVLMALRLQVLAVLIKDVADVAAKGEVDAGAVAEGLPVVAADVQGGDDDDHILVR